MNLDKYNMALKEKPMAETERTPTANRELRTHAAELRKKAAATITASRELANDSAVIKRDTEELLKALRWGKKKPRR